MDSTLLLGDFISSYLKTYTELRDFLLILAYAGCYLMDFALGLSDFTDSSLESISHLGLFLPVFV